MRARIRTAIVTIVQLLFRATLLAGNLRLVICLPLHTISRHSINRPPLGANRHAPRHLIRFYRLVRLYARFPSHPLQHDIALEVPILLSPVVCLVLQMLKRRQGS